MGDAFELQEMGILDEMGEYIGDGRDYREKRRRRNSPNYKKDPRKGIITYIHRFYVGRANMPSALKTAKLYAKEKSIVWTSEEQMFTAISNNFNEFREWMDVHGNHIYLKSNLAR